MLQLRVLGLNSGTCMDAIDISLVEFRQESPEAPLYMIPLKYDELPLNDKDKRDTLRLIVENRSSPQELCELNFRLGHMFADAIDRFAREHDIDLSRDVDLVASHGQTIWHQPDPGPGETKSTLMMGEPTVLANRTGKTTVNDFRAAEQQVGRQGAPLACFQDALALVHPTLNRVSQNIGGIGNCAFVPAEKDGGIDEAYDFDTGPGNVLIDAAVRYSSNGEREYDKDGEMGARGKVHQPFVDEFLKNPYFDRKPPKTTGRELFGDDTAIKMIERGRSLGLSDDDMVATITRITAASIVLSYQRFGTKQPLDEIYFCGGGSFNPNIRAYIQECFPNARLSLLDKCGITAASKEATSFAFMGLECLLGRPMIVPSIEPQEPVICGKITPGRNYGELIMKVAAFHEAWNKTASCTRANGMNGTGGTAKKVARKSHASWLPAVRDLRVKDNQTRAKEQRDPVFMNGKHSK
ncbi:hypothetical protein LTR99_010792 [Exophiala xenobiotica]|uniref:Anhydro-N-acetylmuramic acid kinase n=1 Tax=Vermiconidia calcicola TaxID=1690605 RepID=A0AAV9PVE4_9PEZI|nr:hypothetical protein H2202_010057 [Exophiala xenobiotica]KAK5527894.1 hypothetical protein LTR25_010825 [Vermiconidia calcicola]KAK5538196.1 hypothetical protein LTR23_007160 [Chaetothyriales sp. CCFEE 6169]KAK5189493.1 hypothetical protein LTR92_010546 [Exophiala xenobiotica]KAK5216119.1 hypothetical protein LTR72_010858 [Exophiala xenobiotica]